MALPSTKKTVVRKDSALHFLDSIESSWKGHEQFAVWLVKALRPRTVVDLGFDRGLSTVAFAYRKEGHVFGVDWFEEGNYADKSFALDSAFRNISSAIQLNYAKNIHLIIGPFREVAKSWKRKVDLLHIDWTHSYAATKHLYDLWGRFLKPHSVILIHDVVAHPEGAGSFFRELALPKLLFPHAQGLGIATANAPLLKAIQREWGL